jgi:hypothetical protein
MEITLTIARACNSEAGIISVKRIDGADAREMGTIKFEDAAQERWLLEVLMKWHNYVSLVAPIEPCDQTTHVPTVSC